MRASEFVCPFNTTLMADDINYELLPADRERDETDVNLRSYFSRMSDQRLREYDPTWTDEQTIDWDGNFRCDGVLFLICSERDVDIREYRRVLEEHIALRGI
ncbi:MAG: hypothetical protein HY000_20435 [Planctomycetes bacterium]|nr:hypothetical protein [Planctomycetota bacterium]